MIKLKVKIHHCHTAQLLFPPVMGLILIALSICSLLKLLKTTIIQMMTTLAVATQVVMFVILIFSSMLLVIYHWILIIWRKSNDERQKLKNDAITAQATLFTLTLALTFWLEGIHQEVALEGLLDRLALEGIFDRLRLRLWLGLGLVLLECFHMRL